MQADSIYEKFGLPFVPDANGNPQLNERAIAATCSNDKLVRYDSVRGIYLCYEKRAGLWKEADEVQVKRLLSDLLSDLGQQLLTCVELTELPQSSSTMAATLRVETPCTYISAKASLRACSLRTPFSSEEG